MSDDSQNDIPRHAEAQEGAEVKVQSTDDGGVRVSFSDGSDDLEVSRREFMRISGVAAASAAMSGAACRYPEDEIVPYVDRPDDYRPGHSNYFATVCQGCSAECGAVVKSRAARPIKVDGNPDHPVADGSLCAKGQASHRNLYDPDRAEGPLKIRGDGNHIEPNNGWEDVDSTIVEQLQSNADSVHILTGPRSGSAENAILEDLSDEANVHHYAWEPLNDSTLSEASNISYGEHQTPHYEFDDAKVIVSLGSDFLGTWLSPCEFTSKFADHRDPDRIVEEYADRLDIPEDERWLNRLIAFEGHMTLTGSRADDRYRVRPTDLPAVAMALAHEILVTHQHGPLSDNSALNAAVEDFDPATVADTLNLDAAALEALAEELIDNAGESLIIAGREGSSTPNGIELETAVNLLNRALGNTGNTVDRAQPSRQNEGSYEDVDTLTNRMRAGDVGVLIINDVNPVYSAPPELDFAGALDKVSTVISTHDRVNETAMHADFLAPGQHWLESWGDSSPIEGLHSIQQPAIQPLYDTRSFEESLLVWFGQSDLAPSLKPFLTEPQKPGGQTGTDVPYDPGAWYRYLKDHWEQTVFPKSESLASFDNFWESVLRKGVLELPSAGDATSPDFRPQATANALPAELPSAPQGDPGNLDAMQINAFPTIPLGDGSMANNGHLQELPDPISKHTWGSYALVSPATFEAAGLEQGDILEIDSADGTESLRFPVIMQPGMHDEVISVPLGYGRTHVGTVGNDIGANAYKLTASTDAGQIFAGREVSVAQTGENKDVSIIQGSQLVDLEERPLMATATREDYEQDHSAGVGTHPPGEGLWEEHDYDKKWGMSIDMSRCTGCSACMTACQEENNIPVVGRSGILEGREMHWIRIDRYYRLPKTEEVKEERASLMDDPMYDQEPYISFGEQMTNPQVLMQPMLCQHCENAPCETVCPVLATTHSDDGLNMMTYNRCVGTRYCSNNCPFKVRRFNWYNYSRDRSESIFASIEPELKEHARLNAEEPLPLALNPDVTVRSRGVMEKCTFCVQRIRRAKWQKIEEGQDRFEEDDVVTACEQACPADAIDFGNLLDPKHQVTQQHKKDRAVTPLAHLNVKSSVAYLSDIRDTTQKDRYPEHKGHGGGHGEGHGGGKDKHGQGSGHESAAKHGETADEAH